MSELSLDEVRARYERVRPEFKEQTQLIGGLIKEFLDTTGIGYSLETRTKDVDTFCEKAFRAGKNYINPFNDITDVSGIRIVTLLPSEVERILAILRAEFEIDEEKSVDKGADFDVNEFGYHSKHLILRLDSQRRKQKEYRQALGWVEVQVRTAAQHTWALLDTIVRYKAPQAPPPSLQRRLYGLAAMLELVDRENESIVHDWRLFLDELARSWLSNPLSSTGIQRYVETMPSMSELVEQLADMSIRIASTGEPSLCFRICSAMGIQTGFELDALVTAARKHALPLFQHYSATFDEAELPVRLDRTTVLALLVVSTDPHRFTETALREEFSLGAPWRIVVARQHVARPESRANAVESADP